jgi:hypothetical protein
MKKKKDLNYIYPKSDPCSCEICLSFCKRPGWWTVSQAEKAVKAGYANKMMLEISPEKDFGVLSPAFNGCEGNFALNEFANNGCNFHKNNLCELHSTEHMPLECSFCHHERLGIGQKCHLELEKQWHTKRGQELVKRWSKIVGI